MAWTEIDGDQSNILVKRWDPAANNGAGAWLLLGDPFQGLSVSTSNKADSAIITSGSEGWIVAWLDTGSGAANVYAKQWKYNGAAWESLGSSAAGRGISNSATSVSDLALTTNGNKVSVAWIANTGQVYVKELANGVWSELAGSATGGGVSNTPGANRSPTLAYANGDLFVAWQTNVRFGESEVYAKRYRASLAKWLTAGDGSDTGGGLSNSKGYAFSPRLVAQNNQLFLHKATIQLGI